MNKLLLLGLASVVAAGALGNALAADVGVSVNISQPGFYGRIDIGRIPMPQVIYPRPLIIEQQAVTLVREPIYLRVPPGHEKHWDKHCARYQACGQPVYFVQDTWYRDVYAPRSGQRFEPGYEQRGEHDRHGSRNKHKKDHGHD